MRHWTEAAVYSTVDTIGDAFLLETLENPLKVCHIVMVRSPGIAYIQEDTLEAMCYV